jgi:hypothetical protein
MCTPGEDRCRYNERRGDKYYCLIKEHYERTGSKPRGVPDKYFSDWLRECRPFPDPDEPGHVPPIFDVKKTWPRCGYEVVEVED